VADGFLLVDKPGGWTSHDVVAKTRRLLGERKIGHAGTLDPMATGLLVLGVGRATRLLRFVQGLPKTYLTKAVFGVATETLDADGAVLTREPMGVGEEDVRTASRRFIGVIHQVPPMVSAVKVGGRRLYELAREGEEVERAPRPVEVHEIEVVDFSPSDYPEVVLRVRCGTGTYVRTLADDIARALGGHAHLAELRRTRIGGLDVADALTVETMEQRAAVGELSGSMLEPAAALLDLPAVQVGEEAARAVGHGTVFRSDALGVDDGADGPFRVLDGTGRLLAVYRVAGDSAKPEVVLT
jgi:tRNA pseudouridine55 synthase